MSLTQKDGIQHPALYMNFHSEATHRLISFTDEINRFVLTISQYCWLGLSRISFLGLRSSV